MVPTSSKKALIVIANGSEEMECVIVVDVLRRAKINVIVAGLHGLDTVTCSRGVKITPDISFTDITDSIHTFDCIILPGGMEGVKNFISVRLNLSFGSPQLLDTVTNILTTQSMILALICAAPLVLAHICNSHPNLFTSRNITLTSHPAVQEKVMQGFQNDANVIYSSDQKVVLSMSNKLVTSQGPGTSFLFALNLVELLTSGSIRDQIQLEMCL